MTSPNLFQYRFAALGTECAVYLYAASQAEADRVFDAAEAEVGRIEAKYSRYREYSELARINRAAARGEAVEVDLETGALLDYAFLAYAKSDGLFDITSGILRRAWDFRSGKLPEPPQIEALLPSIGMDKLVWRAPELSFRAPSVELDFGGIGKEYAVDRVADILLSMGVRHTMIDLGGDLRAIGPQWNSQPWEILLRNPVKPNAELAKLEVWKGAVATSGDYERFLDSGGRRYCHLLDPRTGWPAEGLSSVTVQADTCLLAGTVSTIAMLMGREGIDWLGQHGLDHIWVTPEGQVGGPWWPSSSNQ